MMNTPPLTFSQGFKIKPIATPADTLIMSTAVSMLDRMLGLSHSG